MKNFIFLFLHTLILNKSSFGQGGFIFNGNPYVYNEQNPGLAGLKQPFLLELPYKSLFLEGRITEKIFLIGKSFQYDSYSYLKYGYTKLNGQYTPEIVIRGMGKTTFYRNDFITRLSGFNTLKIVTLSGLLGCSYLKTNNILQSFYRIEKYDFSDYQPTGPATASNFEVKQWIPIAGLQIDVNIWKFSLFVGITGSKGFKAHQRLIFPYSYKGIEQPTSVTENRGTGIFREIGIKANFL
jgi:hypothetical protein